MSMNLEGKVAIITGAARGIGYSIAEQLAKHKAKVVLIDIIEELEQAANTLASMGAEVLPLYVDVREESQVEKAIETTKNQFGSVDILVNNAGVSKPASMLAETLDNWHRTIDVNLKGTFLFCRSVLPHMMSKGDGAIINISSKGGLEGFPQYSSYCASKFGIIGLSEALYKEVKDSGIRVNVICPGEVLTQMNLESHPGIEDTSNWVQPQDIASLVIFLASPHSLAVNGSVLKAYGKG